MADENPDFERDENHQFRLGDRVYVIADNEYDIYEAEITAVNDGSFSVHYPEYPDDDTDVGEEYVLPVTERNQKIFDEQEEIRKEKEREEPPPKPVETVPNHQQRRMMAEKLSKHSYEEMRRAWEVIKPHLKPNELQESDTFSLNDLPPDALIELKKIVLS